MHGFNDTWVSNSSSFVPNTTSFNDTAETLETFHVVYKIFASTVMVFIIIVALLGNMLVIYAFFNYHRLRGNVTNYYIVSLAFSDILTATLVIPFELDSFIKDGAWIHGKIMCQIWTTLYLLAAPGSIINLCAVTLDRFIVLRIPLRYTTLVTPKRAGIAIICLWVYALATACLPVIGWKNPKFSYIISGTCNFPLTPEYVILINITNFLLPMIFMAVCWSMIYKIAKKHQRKVKKLERSMSVNETTLTLSMNGDNRNGRTSMSEGHNKKTIRRHLKGSKYIAIIVGTFFLCWLPYTLLSLVVSICGRSCYDATPSELHYMLLLMGYLNSALNPYLYPFHDRQFKDAFKNILFNVQNHKFWDIIRRGNGR